MARLVQAVVAQLLLEVSVRLHHPDASEALAATKTHLAQSKNLNPMPWGRSRLVSLARACASSAVTSGARSAQTQATGGPSAAVAAGCIVLRSLPTTSFTAPPLLANGAVGREVAARIKSWILGVGISGRCWVFPDLSKTPSRDSASKTSKGLLPHPSPKVPKVPKVPA